MLPFTLGPLGTIGHYILTPLYYAISGVMLFWHKAFNAIGLDPNGGASLSATFTVTLATTLTLAQISPGTVAPGSAPFTLTKRNTWSVVRYNDTAHLDGLPAATVTPPSEPAKAIQA